MNKWKIQNNTDNTADLYIYDEIGGWWGENNPSDFRKELDELSGKHLNIHISSPGGSVFDGNTIANLIKGRNGTTTAIIEGLCASIATQIALACNEVKIYKNSLFMIHRASCGAWGNSKDLMKQVKALETIDDILANTYVEKSDKTIEEILDYMDQETWFSASECIELGFANSVIEEEKELVAKFDMKSIQNFKKVPTDFIKSLENKVIKDPVDNLEIEKEKLLMELDLI